MTDNASTPKTVQSTAKDHGEPTCWQKLLGLGAPPQMADHYFKMVAQEFACIPRPPDTDREKAALWDKVSEEEQKIRRRLAAQKRGSLCNLGHVIGLRKEGNDTLIDVLGFELLMFPLLSDGRVLARAWVIRDIYRQLIPTADYLIYQDSNPPKLSRNAAAIKPDEMEAIRQDAFDLLVGTHWWYANSSYRELLLQIIKRRLIQVLIFVDLFVLYFSKCTAISPFTVLVMVTAMGTMGAILSIGRRMLPVSSQNVTDSDPVIRATQFDHGRTGIYLSIVVGASFSIVLYMLMVAGLSKISGTMMPEFVKPDVVGDLSISHYFERFMPVDTFSFAKLLCWSFVAGFAEQFVPDMLDRMSKSGGKTGK